MCRVERASPFARARQQRPYGRRRSRSPSCMRPRRPSANRAARSAATPGHATSTARPGVWLTDASLVCMALIWGVNFSIVKFGTSLVDPLAYNGLRVLLAAVVLAIIALVRRDAWPPRRTVLALLGLGVLGNGVYQFFFVEGIARTSASDTA